MSGAAVLLALGLPPLAAVAARAAAHPSTPVPPEVAIALNAVLPGSGLALLRRPLLEIVISVLLGQAGLLAGGSIGFAAYLPAMVVGGTWAWWHVRDSTASRADAGPPDANTGDTATGPRHDPEVARAPSPDDEADSDEDPMHSGYSVSVACTECGAEVQVPVLHRAARCSFCGSHHLVVGQEELLPLTIPSVVTDDRSLREAVLDHYRYLRYLELYRRSVAPLERGATQAGPHGSLVERPEIGAAAAAAEVAVSRAADAYRATLDAQLTITASMPFYAPYRHGMGTLYQAAFGRSPRDQEKRLRFSLATLESSRLATTAADLPAMGKLSYLRALQSAASLPDDARSLPLDVDLEASFGDVHRKNLCRDLQVIRLGSRLRREVEAVVWRPFWIADVGGVGGGRLLVDGASGSVVGQAPFLTDAALTALPEVARAPGRGLQFVPMECPTCGDEYPFETDAVLHFCRNCHRVFDVDGTRKTEIPYSRGPVLDGAGDLVPFWRFPLDLETGDGERLTDMWHLKDGIDGTLDQIGDDAPVQRHAVWVPAIRCINPKLMAAAFNRLFLFTVRQPPPLEHERFGLDQRPQPWTIGLTESEARELLPLYLTNAFSPRDIARVRVDQVAAWLFEGRQRSEGRLAFVYVPRVLTERFRAYVGRFGARALDRASGAPNRGPRGPGAGLS